MEENQNLMLNIYERLGGIDAKLDSINQVRDTAHRAEEKADNAQDTADKALESTKSAHHRLNKIDKVIWWVSTTIIGAVILALIGLVIKLN
ncbi:hemolysin XhlA family protein [Lysinibacillus halotolerans]|uniref:Hemolysin XhlA n=1 Tax=Lysinibacillus halotolerans TaxID=1368476 RepID=A0A3M8H2W9_9BACI|nr:hemolysin XhlA family protein [Lysinibacillus halotolerans]RNC96260.1 hypothetical protein EC501_17055 [Lysinibacillus halotolerans]